MLTMLLKVPGHIQPPDDGQYTNEPAGSGTNTPASRWPAAAASCCSLSGLGPPSPGHAMPGSSSGREKGSWDRIFYLLSTLPCLSLYLGMRVPPPPASDGIHYGRVTSRSAMGLEPELSLTSASLVRDRRGANHPPLSSSLKQCCSRGEKTTKS